MQTRSRQTVSATLERGVGYSPHQDDTWHGEVQLQASRNVPEGDVDLHARLQFDPPADGAGGGACRRIAAAVELQTHAAGVGRLESTAIPLRCTRGYRGAIQVNRPDSSGNRPGRIEPRLIKQRPKPFPRLQTTRRRARANVKKYGRPKRLTA